MIAIALTAILVLLIVLAILNRKKPMGEVNTSFVGVAASTIMVVAFFWDEVVKWIA